MKLQLHLIDDKDIIIRIVGVEEHRDFPVGSFKEVQKYINIKDFNNPLKWTLKMLKEVIKSIFILKGIDIRNENLKKIYRKHNIEIMRIK